MNIWITFLTMASPPSFISVTRPDQEMISGSSIENIFIKTDYIKFTLLKLNIIFPDHYPILVGFDGSETGKKFP